MENSKTYTGVKVVQAFQHMDEFFKEKKISVDLCGVPPEELFPNMFLVFKAGRTTAMGIVKGDQVEFVPFDLKIGDIKARNKEQAMAMRLLLDPNILCVTISGCPGSGKTLLALAFAFSQLEKGAISKVVLAKNFTPLGREIGFLKGDFDDKVRPWLGNFFDNLLLLGYPQYKLDEMCDPAYQKEHPGQVEISPITFMQGRSISNAVIIVDEVQNLPKDVVKQLLTRPAENCKIILLGDPGQIFEKAAVGADNGLLAAIEAGKEADFAGHLHMLKSERSKVAEWYGKHL